MNYLTGCCFSLLVVTNCFAEPVASSLPPGLIKISDKTNPKCVDYVTYQGEMYCSLIALDKTSVDPQVLSYEKQIIQFDNRAWKAAWGKHTDQISTVEYIPVGDDINNWNEMITTQFIPDSSLRPDQYGDNFLNNLHKSGVTFKVNAIENKPDQLIFEFKVEKPNNLQQDELQKVVKGKGGLYIVHYVIKQADMGKENREKWIANIKKSTLK